jgi:hypothetical protein
MRGHIIVEDRFFHQGIDHHVFVTGIEGVENEYRFEVRRVPPGSDQPETEFEKTINFSARLAQAPDTTIEQLITVELNAIKKAVNDEEDIHAHDP